MTAARQTKARQAAADAAAPATTRPEQDAADAAAPLDPPATPDTAAPASTDQAPAEQPPTPALALPESERPGELVTQAGPAADVALTAAAPLAPPTGPQPTTAGVSVNEPGIPRQQVATGETFVGYVGEDGDPLDPDKLFDMSGTGSLAITLQRAVAVVRRASGRLMRSLAWTPGTEITKAEALNVIAHAKAGRKAAEEFGLYPAE